MKKLKTMNTQEIENILEKYFEGQTTLEEERVLKAFFSDGHVPPGLRKYESHFKYLVSESETSAGSRMSTGNLPGSKIVDLFPRNKRSLVYWLSGVAAGIALIVTIFLKSDPYVRQLESTYTDPELAYQEAKKVLLFVSSKLNNGTSDLERLGRLDQSVQHMNNLSHLDQGLMKTSGTISKYNKLEEIINP